MRQLLTEEDLELKERGTKTSVQSQRSLDTKFTDIVTTLGRLVQLTHTHHMTMQALGFSSLNICGGCVCI